MKKSWHLDRREFLRGMGVSLALPFLSAMDVRAVTTAAAGPRRFATVYFPYGVSMPPDGHEHAAWNWFPKGKGKAFEFNNSLKPFESLRQDLTVLGGLSHPNGRKMGGHDTSDIFLTGAELNGSKMQNTVSADQVAAAHFANETRFSSLVLSTDGGVGESTRASTLSFSSTGQPIPSLNKPRLIFDRMFGVNEASKAQQRIELQNSGSMLDLVQENARSLRLRLGREDQQKLDEYLTSVRQIEQRVESSQRWLDVPKPEVDDTGLRLDATADTPIELIRTMYDLMVLAFQTDSTRLATYQIGNMSGGLADKFPTLLGFGNTMHKLAHDWNKPGGIEALGKWDRFLSEQAAYFIQRLRDTREGEHSLLDNTMVLYGTSNCRTHDNTNYPLVLAGGKAMGFRHGRYLTYGDHVPFANFHLTALNKLGVPADSFADSNGDLSELFT